MAARLRHQVGHACGLNHSRGGFFPTLRLRFRISRLAWWQSLRAHGGKIFSTMLCALSGPTCLIGECAPGASTNDVSGIP